MRGLVVAAFLLSVLAACKQTDTVIESAAIGGTPILLTTADVRLVTERQSPLDPGKTILCAEPSPDVAKALSTAFQATGAGKGAAPAGGGAPISVDAALAFATAEQLAQLTERIPTIQALRDGLFRACEATANGLIGQGAYALILSRYGDLLVTMVLGEAAAGSYGRELAKLTAANATLPQQQSTAAEAGTPPGIPRLAARRSYRWRTAHLPGPPIVIAMLPQRHRRQSTRDNRLLHPIRNRRRIFLYSFNRTI